MPEYDFVNAVELSPLIPAECKTRVMRDLNETRTNNALALGLGALYNSAIGWPMAREHADQALRRLAVPLAGYPSSVDWRGVHLDGQRLPVSPALDVLGR